VSLAGVMGLLQRRPDEFLHAGPVGGIGALSGDVIESRIQERANAKRSKNFAEADRIRNELLDAGIILEDKPGGITEWRRA
jgi:cysteinyl-tRNA synthetase